MENKLSQGILDVLNGDKKKKYYVYGLYGSYKGKENQLFYIGKGENNRVVQHENELAEIEEIINQNDFISDEEKIIKIEDANKRLKEKHKIISDNKKSNTLTRKIIKWGLTEREALMCESALINAYGLENLTNIVNGHMSSPEKENISHLTKARTIDEFMSDCVIPGNIELGYFKKKIRFINIPKTYCQCKESNLDLKHFNRAIYDSVRGCREVGKQALKKIEYVIGIYHSRIVGIYKVDDWKKRMTAIKIKNGEYVFDNDFPVYPSKTRELEKIAMKMSLKFNEALILRDIENYIKNHYSSSEEKEKFLANNPENFKIENGKIIFLNSKGENVGYKKWVENFNKRFYFGNNNSFGESVLLSDILIDSAFIDIDELKDKKNQKCNFINYWLINEKSVNNTSNEENTKLKFQITKDHI